MADASPNGRVLGSVTTVVRCCEASAQDDIVEVNNIGADDAIVEDFLRAIMLSISTTSRTKEHTNIGFKYTYFLDCIISKVSLARGRWPADDAIVEDFLRAILLSINMTSITREQTNIGFKYTS